MDVVAETLEATCRAIDNLSLLLTEEPTMGRSIFPMTGLASLFPLLSLADQPSMRIERSELQSLKTDLEYLSSFLRDEDSKSEEEELSESGKTWVKQLHGVTELIEDVVDEYILRVSEGTLIGALNSHSKLARNFKNIKALLLQVKERGERHSLRERGSSSSRTAIVVERYHSHFLSPVLVGIDGAANELIQRITEGTPRRSVVSLVGFGGIGKTTLAKKVYDNEVVRRHFQYCAWINVSRSYEIKELLRSMVKEICVATQRDAGVNIPMMKEVELIGILRQYLRSKRYMFVFDDVWQEEFWRVMEHALPDGENCSRVIITTRSDAVGASCKQSSFGHVHRLEPLSETMSWNLFRKIAFRHEPELCCPPELEQFSLEFVRMCQGLPLAIVATAGLLSTKEKTMSEWQRLLGSFYVQLKSNPHLGSISKILALSFHDLPSKIKLCFLYFSVFPEESLIPNDKLIKLWIAEGFIQETRGDQTLEEVAEDYLNELIRRNLVQACDGFYELERFCRVHSLMYEVVRQKANEFSFCHVWRNNNSSSGRKSRRLSISNSIQNVLETTENSQVRSVFLFNVGALDKSFVVSLFGKYKLLTLLDFENVPLEYLPNELGNLLHLKYLNLKNTKLKRLPKSLGKLQNLQTLDLRNTRLILLPIEINRLQNLRHLLASYDNKTSLDSTQGVIMKEGIGCLENLQTLVTVVSGIVLMKELDRLRQLRKLGISRLTAGVSSALCARIKEMSRLESLSLHSMNNSELALETISSPPPLLQRLVLKGLLQNMPRWILSLRNLNVLCLSFSRLANEPLNSLSDLPSLVSLWLYRAYDGEQLHFKRDGFQKLKLLVLRELHGLKVLEIEEGALPCLEELRIGSSPLLNEVPSGIQHLRNLKVLANYDMPSEFVLSMQPNGGPDYCLVGHISCVLFLYRGVQGRRYMLYNLGEEELLARVQGSAININDIRWNYTNQLSFSSDRDVDHPSVFRDIYLNRSSVSSDRDLNRLSVSSDRNLDRLSFSSDRSVVQWSNHNRLSFSRVRSIVQCTDVNGLSFSSDQFSFISDDIED